MKYLYENSPKSKDHLKERNDLRSRFSYVIYFVFCIMLVFISYHIIFKVDSLELLLKDIVVFCLLMITTILTVLFFSYKLHDGYHLTRTAIYLPGFFSNNNPTEFPLSNVSKISFTDMPGYVVLYLSEEYLNGGISRKILHPSGEIRIKVAEIYDMKKFKEILLKNTRIE